MKRNVHFVVKLVLQVVVFQGNVSNIYHLDQGSSDTSVMQSHQVSFKAILLVVVAMEFMTSMVPQRGKGSGKEHRVFNLRAHTVRVPLGFDWVPQALLKKAVAMKSHAWKQMISTPILKYCIRGLLGKHHR